MCTPTPVPRLSTMSGDIFGGHSGDLGTTGIQWVKDLDAARQLTRNKSEPRHPLEMIWAKMPAAPLM